VIRLPLRAEPIRAAEIPPAGVVSRVHVDGRAGLLPERVDSTDMVKMAQSIARNNKWTIAPSGNTALNMLGLSTQVPAKWTFVSDGPYKKYNINGIQLEFKHRANRNVSGMSPKTLLVIHALKSLTAEQTTPEVLDKIKSRLTLSEKKKLLEEAIYISRRNLHSIRKICEDTCTP